MAVAYQSFAEAKGLTVTSVAPSKPSGTTTNDLLVSVCSLGKYLTTPSSPTLPSGWTQIHFTTNGNSTLWVAYKVAGGSEPASYTFSWTNQARCYIALMRLDGEDTSSPIDVSATPGTGLGTAVTCPSITTTVDNCLVLAMMAHYVNANVDTGYDGSTTGITVDNAGSNLASGGAEYYTQASAGATGTKSFTASTSNVWVATQVAIAPAAVSGGLGWKLAGERASLAGPGGLAG